MEHILEFFDFVEASKFCEHHRVVAKSHRKEGHNMELVVNQYQDPLINE